MSFVQLCLPTIRIRHILSSRQPCKKMLLQVAQKCCPNFHHLTLRGMDYLFPRALAALLQQGPGSAVSLTVGLQPARPASAPARPSLWLQIVAWFNRATVTSTIDMLDAPALQIQRCTAKLSWVTYFTGVALNFSLSVLLLFLTDCVWPGVTQSQLPLHLLWLGIELWLGAGGNSKCFPLLCRLRLGFRRLRLFLVCLGLPLRMFHRSIKHRFPCVVLAIAVTLW